MVRIQNPKSKIQNRARRGTVLIVVLVVVVLLTLGAYTFTEFMVLEARSTSMHGQAVRARALADSGVELVASQLADRVNLDPLAIYDNPGLYRGVTLRQGTGSAGRFTVIVPAEYDDSGQKVRYGLIDESCRLNVNTLLKLQVDEQQARNMLMYLPYMSEETADAILDFVDEDEDVREFGAETADTYSAMSPPYSAKNGPLDTIDELLLVNGVTPALLFGEDANRNGLLDPNENDGGATLPLDNADGRLDRGWAAYLTVHSRERNVQADGSDRINVNDNVLTDLFDTLSETFDEKTATFVVAYRLSGPVPDPNNPQNTPQPGTPGQQAAQQVGQDIGRAIAGAATSGQDPVTRAGMDLRGGARFTVNSLYDLVGVQVQVNINGVNTTLDSPWPEDIGAMAEYLPDMMDKLTTSREQYIEGRIDLNQASYEVLSGVPGMDQELALAIVGEQQTASNGASLSGQLSTRATTGWLVLEGLVDLPTMRKLDPYLTARGDVYRVQVVGFFDRGGPMARIEAVIDATPELPEIVFTRDLTDLGRGYSPAMVGAQ